jgi:hypothetical protein
MHRDVHRNWGELSMAIKHKAQKFFEPLEEGPNASTV